MEQSVQIMTIDKQKRQNNRNLEMSLWISAMCCYKFAQCSVIDNIIIYWGQCDTHTIECITKFFWYVSSLNGGNVVRICATLC